MTYCCQEDLFEACLQSAVESWATDHPSDTPERVQKRITSAIQRASEEINLYLSQQFTLPLPFVPLSIRNICIKLSLYQLLSRKGVTEESSDHTIKVNYDTAITQLKQIAHGKLEIEVASAVSHSTHTVSAFPKSSLLQRKPTL